MERVPSAKKDTNCSQLATRHQPLQRERFSSFWGKR
jgi:hypothetical protein